MCVKKAPPTREYVNISRGGVEVGYQFEVNRQETNDQIVHTKYVCPSCNDAIFPVPPFSSLVCADVTSPPTVVTVGAER